MGDEKRSFKQRRPADQEKFNSRHWAVVEVFREAENQGLASPGWEPLASLVEKRTGTHIPSGSMKFWFYGHSEPRVSQLEAMALALGLELDIFLEPKLPGQSQAR
jgi:hypothetical protein